MNETLKQFDAKVIDFSQRRAETAARGALFLIFFWFGALKVVGLSPADELVKTLLNLMMPWFPPELFVRLFGGFEVIIGLLFLFPRLSRLAILIFLAHMLATSFPLVVLPDIVWQQFLTPTLEGQYIIKNMALIALAVTIAAGLKPYPRNPRVGVDN